MVIKQRVGLIDFGTVVVCCLAFVGYIYGGVITGSGDIVLGQVDFTSRYSNHGGGNAAADTLDSPYTITIDTTTGRVYVADSGNSRVLWWDGISGLTNGKKADGVLGQVDFTSRYSNHGGGNAAADTLDVPQGVFVDSSGNVWVTDSNNSRVLKYNTLLIVSIVPNFGVNTIPIDITNLIGQEFVSGVVIKLKKSAEANIVATNVSIENLNKITCTFDLIGKATGYWDVVVTSGSMVGTLQNAFEIKQTTITQIVDPTTATTVILQAETGDIKVDLPANTFGEAITVMVTTTTPPVSDRATIRITNICIEINTDKGQQPTKEITITICYRQSDIEGYDENKLCIGRYEESIGKWIALPSIIDRDHKEVIAKTKHLSKFALIQLVPAIDLNNITVYPNPYKSGDSRFGDTSLGAGIVFSGLTANANVRIFNIAGELISELEETDGNGNCLWDIKNKKGNKVASGIYIYYITNPEDNSQKSKGKFAIIK